MTSNRYRRLTAAAVLLAALALTMAGCRAGKPAETAAPVIITPAPTPAIVGEAESAAMINCMSGIRPLLGRLRCSAVMYCGSDELLILATDSETDEHQELIKYNVYGAETGRYVLPCAASNASPIYNSTGAISLTADGGAAIVDVSGNELILLDETLAETGRTALAIPQLTDSLYVQYAVQYFEGGRCIFVAATDEQSCVYKYDLATGTLSEFFTLPCEGFAVTSLELAADGATLTVETRNYTSPSINPTGTQSINYIISTADGAVLTESWLSLGRYSDGTATAEQKNLYYTSDLICDGVKIDIQYLEEFRDLCFDFENMVCVSAVNVCGDSSGALLLSAYDLNTGALTARTLVLGGGECAWPYADPNPIQTSVGSFDAAAGRYCVLLSDDYSDTGSRVLLWAYDDDTVLDEAGFADYAGFLTACPNVTVPEGTARELAAGMGSRYGVRILFADDALRFQQEENDLGLTEIISFSEDYDDDYIKECLMALDDVLSSLPPSILQKITEYYDGYEYALILCSYLNDTALDFPVSGQCFYFFDAPCILVDNHCSDFSGLSHNGSTSNFRSIWYHELFHAMQSVFLGYMDGEVNYDYDTWMSYLPEDFSYGGEADQYTTLGGEGDDSIYFVDGYATTGLLEDMARLFEYATWDEIPDELLLYPHITERLSYLCAVVRGCFDDGTWPEQVFWERTAGPYPPEQ